jgi:DNA replication and repair protein RecF
VRIRRLALQPYRNFAHLELQFPADRCMIVGANGCGKSNVLEAICYLSIGRSVRGVQDQQVVPHGGRCFEVQAQCHDGQRGRELRLYFDGTDGKRVFSDGAALPRVADLIGTFVTVHFSPEDVSLVLRFPQQRRRLLDILVSQSSSSYVFELQRYQRVIRQRNHLLRTGHGADRGGLDGQLAGWDGQAARLGASIRRHRLEALVAMQPLVAEYYRRLARAGESAAVAYRGTPAGSGGIPDEEQLRAELVAELLRSREREVQQRCTLCGPHRDDVGLMLGGHPADAFASEGQLKSLLVAWKMAEARLLERRTSQPPVLLLADPFSELDDMRSHELWAAVDEFEQVILTAPMGPEAESARRYEQIRLPR